MHRLLRWKYHESVTPCYGVYNKYKPMICVGIPFKRKYKEIVRYTRTNKPPRVQRFPFEKRMFNTWIFVSTTFYSPLPTPLHPGERFACFANALKLLKRIKCVCDIADVLLCEYSYTYTKNNSIFKLLNDVCINFTRNYTYNFPVLEFNERSFEKSSIRSFPRSFSS